MAVINLPRFGTVGDAVRDFGFPAPRKIALYLAMAGAGTAIGLSLAAMSGDSSAPAQGQGTRNVEVLANLPAVIDELATGETRPVEQIVVELPEMQPTGVYNIPAPAAAPEAPAPAAAPAAAAPAAAPVASAPATNNATTQPVVSQPAPAAPAPAAPPAAPPAPAAPAQPSLPQNFYLPSVGAVGGMSALESQMFTLMNAERAAAGLPAYQWDASLSRIARIRGHQMIDQGYFGHRDPFGFTMYAELLRHFGIGFRVAGENLVSNHYGYDVTASLAVEGLMNSPTHRANMLDGGFTRVGVGEVTSAGGGHYYTLIFVS